MKRLNGIEFRAGVEKAAAKISSDLRMKCSIYWTGETTTAAIDQSGRVYLASVPDDAMVNQALLEKYIGFVLHELLHRKYTDFSAGMGSGQYLRGLHNAIEDAWIERKAIAAGLTGNTQGLLCSLANQMVAEALEQVRDWADPAQYPFSLAIYARGFCNPVPVARGLEDIFAEAARRIDACHNSFDTYDVARWVYDQIQKMPEKKAEKKADKKAGKQKADKAGDQTGDQPDNKAGDQQADKAGSEAKQGDQKGDQQATRPDAQCKPREVEPTLKKQEQGNAGTYSRAHIVREGRHTKDTQTPRDLTITVPARMRYEVKKLFENTATDEFQINRKAGALNARALHKVHTSDALFKRRLESGGVDSAVVILLDVSGSMFYPTYVYDAQGNSVKDAEGKDVKTSLIDHAVKTCAALVDTLTRAQVKVSIVTFGSYASVLKPFDMPARKGLQALSIVAEGGQTNDYPALRFCHELISGRPEARKVVFVITDGEGDSQCTSKQVQAGANIGITTVGIGIDVNISNVYPQAITVTGSDLGTASFKQIKLAA